MTSGIMSCFLLPMQASSSKFVFDSNSLRNAYSRILEISLSSCSLVLLMANIAVNIALISFVFFIYSSRHAFQPATEASDTDASEFVAQVVVLVPYIGERKEHAPVLVNEVVPLFGICRDDEIVPTFAEFGVFVGYGVNSTAVLLFDFLHFFVGFGLLVNPEAGEFFEEAHFVLLFEALDIRLVNVHLFQNFNCFFFACHSPVLLKAIL